MLAMTGPGHQRCGAAVRRRVIRAGLLGFAGLGLGAVWLILLLGSAPAARAAGPAPPLMVQPPAVVLVGADQRQQLAISIAGGPGGFADCTDQATFQSLDPAVATISAAGLVTPVANGTTAIRVATAGRSVAVPVQVRRLGREPRINFPNQIVPIFTKLGCNAGGCHGKASGQNGFKISLLGFEPEVDYEALTHESHGRRIFPADPDRSLMLLKPTARVPHGGGRRTAVGSEEYRLLRRWIVQGMPFSRPGDPVVVRIEAWPTQRALTRHGRQQLLVTAIYSDGIREDVTRRTQFQSNDPELVIVGEDGVVRTTDQSGQAGIMARYQSQVAVFRAIVPLGVPLDATARRTLREFVPRNLVDRAALAQWRELGLVPSRPCTDGEFLRRASLSITGTLPAPDEVRRFLADPAPDKRARLIDALLERPEYADFFAMKWGDVLRNQRRNLAGFQQGTFAFHEWIRANLAGNTPYDRFVRDIVAARGRMTEQPAVVWYRNLRTNEDLVDNTAEVFLGLRMNCARCHHHPFEHWGQDDYYGMAAVFARIGRKGGIDGGGAPTNEAIFPLHSGEATHPKTGRVVPPKALDGPKLPDGPFRDRRIELADWFARPDNPYFARALVNRYWAHFFGRGIVEPLDDMRVTNPPSNPALLDALARDFVEHHYDLKHLIRTICTSRTFGLSSEPNAYNRFDRQSQARSMPQRLSAEVLLDAIDRLTGVATTFPGLPPGTRAIELPDESVASYFLDVFGRPVRASACECERVSAANLAQSLHMLNSDDIQQKLTSPTGRATLLATRDRRPIADRVEELFLQAYCRRPTPAERAAATAYLGRAAADPRPAYQNLIWALMNSKEFMFNH